MFVASWNVRTLQDSKNSPERKTALVARFLSEKQISIAALSETRFPDSGQLEEVQGGFTFFWIGKPAAEHRQSGTCFAIRNDIAKSLVSLPVGINDRLMSLRLSIGHNRFATFISAYAPTLTNPDDVKDKFYSDLRSLLHTVPRHDKIYLMGDFNARVGCDHITWPDVLGAHGIGKMNSNGLLLLSLCSEFDLTITNTIFQQSNNRKTSWKHPRSKDYHLLDYVIVRRRDKDDVNLTRSFRAAECWSDHSLIRSKITLKITPQVKHNHKAMPKKLDVSKLKSSETRSALSSACDEKLSSLVSTDNIEYSWEQFRDVLYESSTEILGFPKRRHQDWFDENDQVIQSSIQHMYNLHKDWMSDKNSVPKKRLYTTHKNSVQAQLRNLKQAWWDNKARALQAAADTHDMKSFYQNLKGVFGPKTDGCTPILSSDGSLLTDRGDIIKRWAEHFQNVLNRESHVDNDVIDSIPQRPILDHLAADPSIAEVNSAIKQLTKGVPGEDGIPAEVYKCGSTLLVRKLTELITLMWVQGAVPQQFKDASIIHLYKHKGKKCECDNHRGISLLSIAGKILARVILNRINSSIVNSVYPESQCGFRSGRGTIDMIFSLRQIQEKAMEQNQELYMVFVDLTKAFDTVSRDALWKVLAKLGVPEKMLNVIVSFHEGMCASVRSNGQQSDCFSVTNGTKQGCVLAPVLFALFFSVMLEHAFRDITEGIDIEFRMSGNVFNQQRLKAKTLIVRQLIRDLLFADDCALVAHTLGDMQHIIDSFSNAAKAFGLTISIKKTELLYQSSPNNPDIINPIATVDGTALKTVEQFTYLGSTVTSDAKMDKEIVTRIGKASSAFGGLHSRLWKEHDVSRRTKIDVYKAVVITTLLYSAESWTPYRKHIAQLDAFHMRCLRQICQISWDDKIKNSTILSQCNISGIEAFLIKAQLRWSGHLIRMNDNRIPKQLFYGQIIDAPRNRGRPLLRYKDKLKDNLKRLNIDPNNWEFLAADRNAWRSTCFHELSAFEKHRTDHHDQLRQNTKHRHQLLPPGNNHVCTICGFAARSKAGLAVHSRVHVAPAPANLTCNICNKVCKSVGGLKVHARTHINK